MTRFRRFVCALLTLAYAFLGAGPSLWAMGLPQPAAAHACAMEGCSCKMHAEGGACVCELNAKRLEAKFGKAASCKMRPAPCGAESKDGAAPLSLRPHVLSQAPALELALLPRSESPVPFAAPDALFVLSLERPPQS